MNMDRLPDEILLMIFRFIDDCRERAKLELVCRQWRQLMLNHGWKHVRRITMEHTRWIEPIGQRCGPQLADCCFYEVDIDSTIILLIAQHFHSLKHLEFRFCELEELDANALEAFRELGTRLRSFTFYATRYPSHQLNDGLLHHFTRLRHLGLDLSYQHNFGSLPSRFSADLRSLYLNSFGEFSSSDLVQILTRVQKNCPGLMAFDLNKRIDSDRPRQLLNQISELKNLRFLRIALDYHCGNPELLCSCLDKIPNLIALQLNLTMQQLSILFRSPSFHELVHLSLSLYASPSDNFESIGLLSTVAPKLRSLNLEIFRYMLDQTQGVGSQLLKIAQNGTLEHLNAPHPSFTVAELGQFIRLCPNLRSLVVQLRRNEPLPQVSELRSVVANQWHAGTRKYLPLRVWIYGQAQSAIFWRDAFLIIRISKCADGTPSDPVLDDLFQDEVFNDCDSGGIPAFVTEHYSSSSDL